jgi:hypothetical protein
MSAVGRTDPRAAIADPSAYRFQMALIEAIEAHVRALRWSRWGARRYRGADFGRVIAVELYFRLINDTLLRAAFDRHEAGETLPAHPDDIPVSTVANWAFEHMRHSYRNPLTTRAGLKRYVRDVIGQMREFRPVRVPETRSGNHGIAFVALSRRYYRYLRPIALRLGEPVTWIVPAGAGFEDELKAHGDRYELYGRTEQVSGPSHRPVDNWASTAQRYDAILEVLEHVRPAVAVVVEGNNADDELFACAAAICGARSICIQQGWSPVIHNGFRQMHFDLFCVWGEEFARMLKPYNKRQHFVVTGSHMITPLDHKVDADAKGISFFLQKDSLLISNAAWLAMLDLISWCARQWPERDILVREHPASPLNAEELSMIGKEPNIRLCRAQDVSLVEVLDRSAVSVAIFSTTLIEAAARHVVPLIVNVTGAPRYCPDLDALGVGMEVPDFEAAKVAMSSLLGGSLPATLSARQDVMRRFFAVDTDAALDNIASAIKKARKSN